MGLYEKYVLPRLLNCACSMKPMMKQREKVVPLAHGRVLEIGIGSGLNLPYYDPRHATHVLGLEPSAEMRKRAARATADAGIEVELLDASADNIPLDNDSVDSVLITYTLCTIPSPLAALTEIGRVLRPGGPLIFCEHGAAPDAAVRRWQDRLNPIWNTLAGGCHLNRDIPGLLAEGGLSIQQQESMYLPGWRPASFNYWGVAHFAGDTPTTDLDC